MKLSERMQHFVTSGWGSPKVKRWATEVAQLEADLKHYMDSPVRVDKMIMEQIAQLEADNEALIDALNHCGYDPDDCIDCGDSPHNKWCRFWKIRHLLSYWETD